MVIREDESWHCFVVAKIENFLDLYPSGILEKLNGDVVYKVLMYDDVAQNKESIIHEISNLFIQRVYLNKSDKNWATIMEEEGFK
jgi:hypothetical protein